MATQIHKNLPYEDYRKLPGMNQSTLKEGLRSMAHLRYALDHPRAETSAMALGTAFHTLTTEPEAFDERYAIGGPVNPKTGKTFGPDTKAFGEWAEAQGKPVLTTEQADHARAMAASIRGLPLAEAILGMPGMDVEVAITWTDEDTGIDCKCRLDTLVAYTKPIVSLDLKSTQDARPGPFASSVAKYGYHIQSAMYSDAIELAFGELPRFIFACVESSPPYLASLIELRRESVEIGRDIYKRLLQGYADCMATGEWPGYPTDIQHVSLPRWAEREAYVE